MANETDILSTDLEVNDRDAFAKLETFYKKLRETATGIDTLPDGSRFAAAFSARLDGVSKTAEKTRATLASVVNFNTQTNSFDGLSQAAIRFQQETIKANARVRETQRILSEYKGTNQSLFKVLTQDAEQAESALAKLERRAEQVSRRANAPGRPGGNVSLSSFQKTNLGYQANDIATQAALGQSPVQILASQGGQIAQIFSGEQIAAFTAKYAALVPVLGLGAAALALTYKITGDIRDAAERRLNTEEKIASILNKQRIEAQKLTDEFNKKRKDDTEARRITYFQEDNSIEIVQSRRDQLQKLLDLRANDTTKEGAASIAQMRNEFDILDKQLQDFERRKQKIQQASADAAFDQRKADYRRNQEIEKQELARSFQVRVTAATGDVKKLQAIYAQIYNSPIDNDAKGRFFQQISEEVRAGVQAGKDKVGELRKSVESVFSSLYAQTGAQNPFVAVLTEGERAMEALKLSIATLSPELQKQAIEMQQILNDAALFGTRLETGLQAIGLRDEAARFRSGGAANRPVFLSGDERDAMARRFFSSEAITGDTSGFFNNGRKFDNLTDDEKQKVFIQSFLRGANDGNHASFVSSLATQLIGEKPGDANLDVQQRLQKQIDFVNSLGAKTDAEKQIADRKIIALTSSLDPSKITDSERNAAATARENEARRIETGEQTAATNRTDQLATMKNVDKNIDELLKIAKSDGLTGVIRIINDADDRARVELGKRPNDRSTEKMTK